MRGKSFIKEEIESTLVYKPRRKILYEMVSSIHIIEKLFNDVLDDIYEDLKESSYTKKEYILLEEVGKAKTLRDKFQYYLNELTKMEKTFGYLNYNIIINIILIISIIWLISQVFFVSSTFDITFYLNFPWVLLCIAIVIYSRNIAKRRTEAAKHLKIIE